MTLLGPSPSVCLARPGSLAEKAAAAHHETGGPERTAPAGGRQKEA
ncbi:hypothetical protein [Streptomyces sp. XH2]